jgi:DNA-binding NarL/FixJ family response regulator
VRVTTSAAALGEALREPPDLIVCDLNTGEAEGLAFYRELGEKRPSLAARVVFVAGAQAPPVEAPVVTKPADLEGTILALLAS